MKWRLPYSILQQRIFERLNTDLVGTPIQSRVWDSPPDGTKFPLVLIGDMSTQANYAKAVPALDVFATIDIYSSGLGMEQVQTLASSVSESITRLDVDLSASSFKCFSTDLQTSQTLREYGGTDLTRHAILVFRFKVQDLAN